MAIVLDMVLVSDRYDAGDGSDPRRAEWPPHPARVFSALRSVADEADLGALRVLEGLGPPEVHASAPVAELGTRAYVVTNSLAAKGGNLNHLGRTSGLRERRSVIPTSPRVLMVWPDDEAMDAAELSLLDALARRVPYLGRSTSLVLMEARREASAPDTKGLEVWRPCQVDEAQAWLRVPYPGYLKELEALHAMGAPAWQASDGGRASQPYCRVTNQTEEDPAPAVVASPYHDLVVLRFTDRRPPARLTALFTAALRSHVMKSTADPLPPAVHGHGIDGQEHVAYLGLPVSGWPHSDGHLVGLAVAIPGMTPADRRQLLRGVLGNGEAASVALRVPGLRSPVPLEYRPEDRLPYSATPERWTRPSREWVSVTPVVLDRYPKRGDVEKSVAHSFGLAGLPTPADLQVSTSELTPGAARLLPGDLPPRARGRLFRHVRARFDEPVAGPVLVGAGRYFGVGLLAPEQQASERS